MGSKVWFLNAGFWHDIVLNKEALLGHMFGGRSVIIIFYVGTLNLHKYLNTYDFIYVCASYTSIKSSLK
jgi:hypothetical protein